jgi:D-cysteine desulfhydrase
VTTDVTAASTLALERRFPRLAGRLDRVHLTTLPTRVEPLRVLGDALGADLWIKRDDVSAEWYGGNKPRKLEFLLGAVLRRGYGSVLTFGPLGTHHGLATTIAARIIGLPTMLVLVPQPVTPAVRHALLLDHAYGAELHLATSVSRAALVAAALVARETLAGRRPLVVMPGGTSPTGVLGFVNAGLELAEQIARGEAPEPAAVFVALGTGGTAAGLLLGFALAGLATRVVAVLVTDVIPPTHARVLRLAARAWRLLSRLDPDLPRPSLAADRLTIVTDQLGAGYGAATAAAEEARRRLEQLEGVRLDSTYTAKCAAALLAQGAAPASRVGPLLFWHTYSAVDPAARIAVLPEPAQLPPQFRRFFAP